MICKWFWTLGSVSVLKVWFLLLLLCPVLSGYTTKRSCTIQRRKLSSPSVVGKHLKYVAKLNCGVRYSDWNLISVCWTSQSKTSQTASQTAASYVIHQTKAWLTSVGALLLFRPFGVIKCHRPATLCCMQFTDVRLQKQGSEGCVKQSPVYG